MRKVTIERTSVFPASTETVWQLLGQVETLQKVARPYASFVPLDGRSEWRPGGTYRMRLRLLGLIPLGTHTIHVLRWNRDSLCIFTRESNPFVPLWEHQITLSPYPGGCRYTDRVTLGAGWKTPFVRLWALCFYRHRQKKWIRLLSQN